MSLLVGFSPHQDDHAALDLACQAGLTFRQPVDAVTVVPQGWPTPVAGHTDREFERWASEEGEASVAEATSLLARHADVETAASWRSGRSVPQVLLDSARADSAFAIVVAKTGTDEAAGHRNYSLILVPTDTPARSATRVVVRRPTPSASKS